MNIAPISSQSSFNSKSSKKNKWIAAGAFGGLGISTIAMNQDSQKNTEFNALLGELQNNDVINQATQIQTTTPSKPKRPIFNANHNGLFAGATAQLNNFINFTPIYMDELDNECSYNSEATKELFKAIKKATKELFKAIKNGTYEDIQHCLDNGADLNAKDDNYGWTPLYTATVLNNIDAIKALLVAGADTEAKTKDGHTPLHFAAEWNDIEMMKLLLEKGANINVKNNMGWTPLYSAVNHHNIKAMKLLFEKGANINDKDNNGWTPLHWAAIDKNTKAIKLFLHARAAVNAKNKYEDTPLHIAVKFNNVNAIRPLLDAGAAVNAKNKHKNTPLHIAVKFNNVNAIRLLLYAGADVDAKNKAGHTPYDLAIANNQKLDQETINLLKPVCLETTQNQPI